MIIKQLSIFVENRPGRMAEATRAISDAGVDIRALSVADTSDFGILRLIVDQPDIAMQSLQQADMAVSLTDVIAVGIADAPGAFADLVQLLSDNGIGIEYMYAFLSRADAMAYVILRMEDPDQAIAVLKKHNIRLLSSDEVYHM